MSDNFISCTLGTTKMKSKNDLLRKMELFKVVAKPPIDGAEILYLRVGSGDVRISDEIVMMSPGSELSTDTYYNLFSSSKYNEYTRAEEISITTSVQGRMEIELRSFSEAGDTLVDKKQIDEDIPTDVTFRFEIKDLNDENPVCHYLSYRSESESTILSFGSYRSEIEPDDIDMGIVICTFKREDRVKKTIKRIEEVLSHNDNGISDKITVYVIDNGRTLEDNLSEYSNVRIIPNDNDGGSGGFARGMAESRKDGKTHILLMDDDIELDSNVISKTFNFTSILKDNHKDAFILGGMLLPETPSIQYEAGAIKIPNFKRGKHMLDVSVKDNLILNDMKEPAQYGGWWYLCMPSSAADELPFPMFIKRDDEMFGIRRMKDHVVMNGIGVWHDSFESKTNPIIDYYFSIRNSLVFDSIYLRRNGILTGAVYLRRMMKCLKKGENKEYNLSRLAIRDFLKGPILFTHQDVGEILSLKLSDRRSDANDRTDKILLSYRTLNEFFSLVSESLTIILKWNNLGRKYRDSIRYLTSYEFWEDGWNNG